MEYGYDTKDANIDSQHSYMRKILTKTKINFRISVFIDQKSERTIGSIIWAFQNIFNYVQVSTKGKTDFRLKRSAKKRQPKGLIVYNIKDSNQG